MAPRATGRRAASTSLGAVVLLAITATARCDAQKVPDSVIATLAPFAGPPAFAAAEIRDPAGLASRLRERKDPVSAYLLGSLDQSQVSLLQEAVERSSRSAAIALVGCLNSVLLDRRLYDPKRFRQVALSDRTSALLPPASKGVRLVELNYHLLCDAYPDEIAPAKPEPSYRGRRRAVWREVDSYSYGQARIEVDATTGEVTSATYPAMVGTSSSCVSGAEADAVATSWLAQRGVKVAGYQLVECRRLDHGTSEEVNLRWEECSPRGVRLPSFVVLSLNPQGLVQAYVRVRRPVTVKLEPTITDAEAVRRAAAAVGRDAHAKGAHDLRVWFTEDGKQRLLWVIPLRIGDQLITCHVDAHSGEVVEQIPLLGQPAPAPRRVPGVGARYRKAGRESASGVEFEARLPEMTVVRLLGRRGALTPAPGLGEPIGPLAVTLSGLALGDPGYTQLLEATAEGLPGLDESPAVLTPCWLIFESPNRNLAYYLRFDPRTGEAMLDDQTRWRAGKATRDRAQSRGQQSPAYFEIRVPRDHPLYAKLTPEQRQAIGLTPPRRRGAGRTWSAAGLAVCLVLAVGGVFRKRRAMREAPAP